MELRQITDALLALGYQIFAISVEKPEILRETAEKFNLRFPLLSDSKAELLKKMGIAWHVIGKDDEYYAKLERASGETHYLLPAPATFIVNSAGVIAFEYINPDFKIRPRPELIVAAAKAALPQAQETA